MKNVVNVWTGNVMVEEEKNLKRKIFYETVCPVCKLEDRSGHCMITPYYPCGWKYCPTINKPKGQNK